MTGKPENMVLLELTRSVAGRYRRLAEHSRLLENAQRRLIHMMESGTVGMDVLREEKGRIEDMKKVLSDLKEEAETADRNLREYKDKKSPDKVD